VDGEILEFDMDEIVFFSKNINDSEIREIGSRQFQAAY
jgi:hypothetical protein